MHTIFEMLELEGEVFPTYIDAVIIMENSVIQPPGPQNQADMV